MVKKILFKLLDVIPTVLGISLIAFLLIRLIPGDPVMLLLGERGADPEVYEKMKSSLGLDLPWYEQYWNFLSNALKGDFGQSIISKNSVWEEFSMLNSRSINSKINKEKLSDDMQEFFDMYTEDEKTREIRQSNVKKDKK